MLRWPVDLGGATLRPWASPRKSDRSQTADFLRRSYARVNAVLARNGLPAHHEPEYFFARMETHSCSSFPYSDLHCMRPAFAHVWRGLPVPDADELRPAYQRERRPELEG